MANKGLKGNESAKGKGFDGNPQNINMKGRPKGFAGLTDTLRDIVHADGSMRISNVYEVDPLGSETGMIFKNAKVKIPKKEMIALAALKKSVKGDMRAVEFIFDRLEGRAQQTHILKIELEGFNSDLLTSQQIPILEFLLKVGNAQVVNDQEKFIIIISSYLDQFHKSQTE